MSSKLPDSDLLEIDHIVVAAPDLTQAKTAFAEWTGAELADGGPHPGAGTCNALGSFRAEPTLTPGAYLEVIAPDPDQAGSGSFTGSNGERFAELTQPTLLHWAVRTRNLPAVAELAKAAGFVPGPIHDMARVTPEGERLQWQLLGVSGRSHTLGGLVPFFIDWQASPHPADSAPAVGGLTSLSVPKVPGLDALLANVRGVQLGAPDSGMIVEFRSMRGDRGWQATAPEGFRF